MSTDYKNLKRFEKSQVNGLTKLLSGLRFREEFRHKESYRINTDKLIEFCKGLGLEIDYNDAPMSAEKFVFTKPRAITKEQTQLGKAWLKNHFFKLNGKPRGGKATQYVGDRVLEISKSVSRFEFIGVLGCMNSYGEIVQFLPIYRTYNRKGQYFDYSPVHWGQPVIMEG